jgi:hypothetical protein
VLWLYFSVEMWYANTEHTAGTILLKKCKMPMFCPVLLPRRNVFLSVYTDCMYTPHFTQSVTSNLNILSVTFNSLFLPKLSLICSCFLWIVMHGRETYKYKAYQSMNNNMDIFYTHTLAGTLKQNSIWRAKRCFHAETLHYMNLCELLTLQPRPARIIRLIL